MEPAWQVYLRQLWFWPPELDVWVNGRTHGGSGCKRPGTLVAMTRRYDEHMPNSCRPETVRRGSISGLLSWQWEGSKNCHTQQLSLQEFMSVHTVTHTTRSDWVDVHRPHTVCLGFRVFRTIDCLACTVYWHDIHVNEAGVHVPHTPTDARMPDVKNLKPTLQKLEVKHAMP